MSGIDPVSEFFHGDKFVNRNFVAVDLPIGSIPSLIHYRVFRIFVNRVSAFLFEDDQVIDWTRAKTPRLGLENCSERWRYLNGFFFLTDHFSLHSIKYNSSTFYFLARCKKIICGSKAWIRVQLVSPRMPVKLPRRMRSPTVPPALTCSPKRRYSASKSLSISRQLAHPLPL